MKKEKKRRIIIKRRRRESKMKQEPRRCLGKGTKRVSAFGPSSAGTRCTVRFFIGRKGKRMKTGENKAGQRAGNSPHRATPSVYRQWAIRAIRKCHHNNCLRKKIIRQYTNSITIKTNKMQLTKNFRLEEFKCKDGTNVPPEYEDNVRKLAENLQVLRDYINTPIIITSGYRTKEWNRRIGGSSGSLHMEGKAADIKAIGLTPQQLQFKIIALQFEDKIHKGGLKKYAEWVHYDIGNKRTW